MVGRLCEPTPSLKTPPSHLPPPPLPSPSHPPPLPPRAQKRRETDTAWITPGAITHTARAHSKGSYGSEGSNGSEGREGGGVKDDGGLVRALSELDGRVGALWRGLPPHTLLVVATGQGDAPDMERMMVGCGGRGGGGRGRQGTGG